MTETAEEGTSSTFKIGISVWLSFCLFVCLWFLSRFMTGRRQLRNNLHVIEDGLKRMQDEIEKRQKEKVDGYSGDNLEELMEELLKKDKEATCPAPHFPNFNFCKMRSQKVGVDIWKMILSSCSYLGLACAAWILIKLVCACFWLPNYLQTEGQKEKEANPTIVEEKLENDENAEAEETEPLETDKKND